MHFAPAPAPAGVSEEVLATVVKAKDEQIAIMADRIVREVGAVDEAKEALARAQRAHVIRRGNILRAQHAVHPRSLDAASII